MQFIQITEPENFTESQPKIVVGIDFGTTNSLIAYFQDSQPHIIPDRHGQELLPSIVLLGSSKIKSIKRLLAKQLQELTEYTIPGISSDNLVVDNGVVKIKIFNTTTNKSELLSPIEIASQIFQELKTRAEAFLGISVSLAVVTVPAYFHEAARKAISQAAAIAGIKVIRLLAEPTAAAYSYGLENKSQGKYLVYDLGGGTFDISLLNIANEVFEVLATGGDANLGGDDIDQIIFLELKKQFNTVISDYELFEKARYLKESLSNSEEANICIQQQNYTLTLNKFNELILPIIQRTILLTKKLLLANNKSSVDGIILTGGSTRIKLIKQMLQQHLPSVNILDNLDPDKIVALGAASFANNLINKQQHLLLDVNPLSLGLEVMGGIFEKMILKDTSLPASITKEFTTYVDNQTSIIFNILQGESEMIKDAKSLGYFELKNLPAMPAGQARVIVSFKIDENGLLSVSICEKNTGISESFEIDAMNINSEQINEIIFRSYANLQEDQAEKKVAELLISAQQLSRTLKYILSESDISIELSHLEPILNQLQEAIDNKQIFEIQEIMDKFNSDLGEELEQAINLQLSRKLKGKNITELEKI